MATPSLPPDLTRWNRSGLARVQYVDGNAAVFLERLRQQLAAAFTTWPTARQTPPTEPGALKAFLEGQYRNEPDDLLWQIVRTHARAAHILAGTLDAYANEGWIGTATQWESVRRLVAMLDYAPHPPGSASTPMALQLKDGKSGKVGAGLQFKHTPADGSQPVVFETLEDLAADSALNRLHAWGHDRNPAMLSGTAFVLEGRLDTLKLGEPVVFEREAHETGSALSAHVLTGLQFAADSAGADTTCITVAPPLARAAGFVAGHTWVHAAPKEALKLAGPPATGAEVDCALELADGAGDLVAGEIVAIGRLGAKPLYRRLKRVSAERLVFHQPLGAVDLEHAFVDRPVAVPITRQQGGRGRAVDGRRLQALMVAGDWQWLLHQWLADVRQVAGREVLPVYECIHAHYRPVTGGDEADQGYTTITLAWESGSDRVGTPGNEPRLDLVNPQALLAPPRAIGPVRPDMFLQESVASRLVEPLLGTVPKKISAGDLAVVLRGRRAAWARLAGVAVDRTTGQSMLTSESGFTDRGGAPFFLHDTRLHGHFSVAARLSGWQRNSTPLAGAVVPLESAPAALQVGRTVIAGNGSAAVLTRVQAVNATQPAPTVTLRDPVPPGTTRANFVLHGNVAQAGHGETRPDKVLGSGDATRSRQRFALEVSDASFVADAAMPSGVRADLQVWVDGERWTQVARLDEGAATAALYQVRQREDGSLLLEFGDGSHGRRLPTGANNVRAGFRQGSGSGGNLPAGSLAKLARPHAFVSAGVQPLAASGGGDRESADAMRTNASATLLALERAVSLDDYAHLARSQATVAQARAFALPPGRGQREKLELRIIPAGGASFTTELGLQVQAFLLAHSLPGVQVNVLGYAPLRVKMQVTVRVCTEAFEPDAVAAAVHAALVAAFGIERRQLGQPLFSGEVFAAVEAVQGVENSDCSLVVDAATADQAQRVSRNADGGVIAIRPWPHQCVHLTTESGAVTVAAQPFQL